MISVFLLLGPAPAALAAENGTGLYPLGYRVFLPGVMPEAGVYFRNDFYWYSASANAVVIENEVTVNGDIRAFADFVNLSLVFPAAKLIGADYGIVLAVPVVYSKISGDVDIAGMISDKGQSHTSGGGDILFTPVSLGWHWGKLHFMAALSMYFPTGEYHKNTDITIGKNRFALDPNIAFTWFDPELGYEASAALGYTMNQANRTTQYKSGDEIHLDFTLAKYFKNGVAAGCGGYYYQQVTADRGNGALLGPSKGRVIALGPIVSYNTKVKGHDISLSFKYFREFDSKDRWSGNAFYLTSIIEF